MNILHTLSTYLYFSKTEFNRLASFKLANIAGFITNTFFMLFRAAVFQALFTGTATIAGYSVEHTLTYIVWVQAFITAIPQWGSIGVNDDIKTGQIAMDLSRPINYYCMIMGKRVGSSIFFLVSRGSLAIMVGTLLGYFSILPTPEQLIIGIISFTFGVLLTNSIHFLVELSGFWLETSRGPKMFIVAFSYFFSGAVIPITLFPPAAKAISKYLPFQYTLNAPIEIFIGTTNIYQMLAYQFGYLLILMTLCLTLLKLGEHKLTLHGG